MLQTSEITSPAESILQNEKAPPTENNKAPPTGTLEPIPSTSYDNTPPLDVSPRVILQKLPFVLQSFDFYDKDRPYIITVKRFLPRKRHTGHTDSQNITEPEKDKKYRKHKRDKQQ